jgi:hypothetical protein
MIANGEDRGVAMTVISGGNVYYYYSIQINVVR